jgi:hypothetical protein
MDYSVVIVIEGRSLQREGNGTVPWSSLQTEVLARTSWGNARAESSTKDGGEAVGLCAFTPPGSLDHSVVLFP